MLSLAILNFNGADSLRESIQSVLDQTVKPDRFVVIDNASTDNSRQIAVDMGVEVVDADNKHKFITGLNTAIKLNQDLLFFMQNDVVLDEECLEIMLEEAPKESFIAQPVIYETSGVIDNAGMDIYWPGVGMRRHTQWWNGYECYEPCGLVTTICFMTDNKRMLYDTIFSPAYYEDLDFKLRTAHLDHVLVPYAKATHKGNHTFSQSYKREEISRICWINRNKFINKHYSGLGRVIRTAVSTAGYVACKAVRVITQRRVSPNNSH